MFFKIYIYNSFYRGIGCIYQKHTKYDFNFIFIFLNTLNQTFFFLFSSIFPKIICIANLAFFKWESNQIMLIMFKIGTLVSLILNKYHHLITATIYWSIVTFIIVLTLFVIIGKRNYQFSGTSSFIWVSNHGESKFLPSPSWEQDTDSTRVKLKCYHRATPHPHFNFKLDKN